MQRILLFAAALSAAAILQAKEVKGSGSFKMAVITADNVNLRSGPGTDFGIQTSESYDWQGKPYSGVPLTQGWKNEEIQVDEVDDPAFSNLPGASEWYFAVRACESTPFYINKRFVKVLETAGFEKPDRCRILVGTDFDNPSENDPDDPGCFAPSAEALFIYPDGTCLLHNCGFENYVQLGHLNDGTAVFETGASFIFGETPSDSGSFDINTDNGLELRIGRDATLEAQGISYARKFDIPAWYLYSPETLRRIFNDLKSKDSAYSTFSYTYPEKFQAQGDYFYNINK